MILPMMPYDDTGQKNLGSAYNQAMARLWEDDWAILLDHDIIAGLNRDWVPIVQEAIRFRPDAGAFVAVTNRIDAAWQRAGETDPDNHDVLYHTEIAATRAVTHRTILDVTETKGFGGVAFALSKRTWQAMGGFAEGMLCVDHSMFFKLQRACRPVYLVENWYVYHRRRAGVGPLPEDTPRVKGCPCRGREMMPTIRLPLPERRA